MRKRRVWNSFSTLQIRLIKETRDRVESAAQRRAWQCPALDAPSWVQSICTVGTRKARQGKVR